MSPKTSCRLQVGTSGYSYNEWVEAGFYPPGTPAAKMLPLYAEQFKVVELNYTWYQMPKAAAIERQRLQVPSGFGFAVKLTRTLTHEVSAGGWAADASAYRDGVAPLMQSGQLLAVLIQLPPSFARTPGRRRHLGALLDTLCDLPLVVEFRHRSWAIDRVFAELEQRKVTLVSVDEPDLPGLFPALDVVTNPDLLYVRFHGRNAENWRTGNLQHKFDYDYSEVELLGWAEEKLAAMSAHAKSGLLFFNNHVAGQATRNARSMATMLKKEGYDVG
jgi:uncharacterized protein YecE (DUF72 family)